MLTRAQEKKDKALATELFTTDRFRSLFLRLRAVGFELISAKPFIMRHPSFLSEQECEKFMAAAEGHFSQSAVGYGHIKLSFRDSHSANLTDASSAPALKARLLQLAGVDVSVRVERLDVVRYTKGQHFNLHYDAHSRSAYLDFQRPYTFFVYLNDVDEKAGGATSFPLMKPPFKQQPRRGVCLFWANWDENYQRDMQTKHQAEPILVDGVTKHAMNCFIEETR